MADRQSSGRGRLDIALVARGKAPSRSRAQDLIRRGLVMIDGKAELRPGALIAPDTAVAIASGADADRVSRGGEKLEAGLTAFGFSPDDRVCLDVGASTGGFTESLLRHGARRVYAVDVGRDQLHPSLRGDSRIVSLEGRDARGLSHGDIPDAVEAIVADVSFISLRLALTVPLSFAAPGCWLIALVKPQFEAGRDAVGKGGIVRDPHDRARAVDAVRTWLDQRPGWSAIGVTASPITGGSGNIEFLIGGRHDG